MSDEVKDRIQELGVKLVRIDLTSEDQIYFDDLARVERNNIPVNLFYPADYPDRPAILLEELFGPKQALQALERIAPGEKSIAKKADAKAGKALGQQAFLRE